MRKSSILVSILGVGLVLALAAPPASAVCPSVNLGTNVASGTAYAYIDFGNTSADSAPFIGQFWQTLNPANGNGGSYNVSNWLFGYPGYPNYWYFYINTAGDVGIVGCPAENMTVYLEDTTTDTFVVWTTDFLAQSPYRGFEWDYADAGGGGFITAASSPRPRVNSSARVGSNVELNITVPSPAAGQWQFGTVGTITGATIYGVQAAAPDVYNVGAWTTLGSLGATGGTTDVVVDCTTTAPNQWIATGLILDGVAAPVLSEPVEVECDPTLADPGGDFKVIQRDTQRKRVRRDN
jgi:hypothetical protein